MKYKDLPPDKQVGPYVWNHQAHLGSGAYGKVYLGRDTKQNSKWVAIKVMENAQIADPYLQQALKNEINILKALKGDNVVGLYDYLQTKSRSYIIQMFCNQGDFRSYLTKRTKLPEPEAKKVLSDLLTGFKELVDNNLIHRDLKPENILIHDNVFKVADYGFGKQVSSSKQVLQTCCGTPLYMSPQILQNQKYTSKSDVWSMGLIYYEMLFGTTPWQCRSQYELVQKTSKEPVKFPYGCKISKESQNFILGCLQVNEEKRLSWEQVFKHPVYEKKNEELQYDKNVQFSKETIQIIMKIQNLMEAKGMDIEQLFRKVNRSGNNRLDQKECLGFLQYIDPNISQPEAMAIFNNFDADNSGFVSLQEFQAIFCNTNFNNKQENTMLDEYRAGKLVKKLIDLITDNNINIDRMFKRFDDDGDQTLNLQEFIKILKLIDETLTDKEAEYIFKKFDKDHSGSLSLPEFKKIIYDGVEGLGGDPHNKKEYGNVKGKMSQQAESLIYELRKIIAVNNLDPMLIFSKFDKDKSGDLSLQEFGDLLKVVNARLTQDQIIEIFKAFDQNNDQSLSIQEFRAYITP